MQSLPFELLFHILGLALHNRILDAGDECYYANHRRNVTECRNLAVVCVAAFKAACQKLKDIESTVYTQAWSKVCFEWEDEVARHQILRIVLDDIESQLRWFVSAMVDRSKIQTCRKDWPKRTINEDEGEESEFRAAWPGVREEAGLAELSRAEDRAERNSYIWIGPEDVGLPRWPDDEEGEEWG